VTKAAIGRGLAPGLPMHLPIVIVDSLLQRTRSSSSSSFSSTSSAPSPSSYGGSCLARRLTSFPLSRLLDTFTSPSVRVLGFLTITIHHTHTRLSSCPSFWISRDFPATAIRSRHTRTRTRRCCTTRSLLRTIAIAEDQHRTNAPIRLNATTRSPVALPARPLARLPGILPLRPSCQRTPTRFAVLLPTPSRAANPLHASMQTEISPTRPCYLLIFGQGRMTACQVPVPLHLKKRKKMAGVRHVCLQTSSVTDET